MKRQFTAAILAASLALSACANMTDSQKAQATAATAGAIGGGVLATLLGGEGGWVAAGAIAGAVAGTMVAKNDQTGECYFANGDGTYTPGPCQ